MRYAFIKMHQKAWPITLIVAYWRCQKQVIMIDAALVCVQHPIRHWMSISEKCLIEHKGRYGSPRNRR